MLVTALCSAILFFITTGVGYGFKILCEKITGLKIPLSVFEILIAGLIVCFIYFNLCSFFVSADFKLLFMPFVLSVFISIKYKTYKRLYDLLFFIKQLPLAYFISGLSLLVLFFVYWLMPPVNGDSGDYHYATIGWYENYKVIPGLANIHGRFAFNPASFILSAPFCFTDIFHQSIYPLNGVLLISFFGWLFKHIILSKNNFHKLVLAIIFFLLLRIILRDISSPTPDVFMVICAAYIILKICMLGYEKNFDNSTCFFLFIIFCFAVTVKLTLAPLILFIPFLLIKISKQKILLKPLVVIFVISILIALPWLIRNYIFSGYLFFPVPYSDFGLLQPDWKVPKEVIRLDYMYCAYKPYHISDYARVIQMNLFERLKALCSFYLEGGNHTARFVELMLALFSPIYWIIIKLQKTKFSKEIFLIWLVTYVSSITWFLNSPEFRFGTTYFLFAYTIPLSIILQTLLKNKKDSGQLYFASHLCLWLIIIFFTVKSLTYIKPYSYSVKDCRVFPLKSVYYHSEQAKSFKYTLLNDGKTKLYLEDSSHNCLNAPGPCMIWYYGQIEMRGNTIEDGFRNVKNEVERDYPFVK